MNHEYGPQGYPNPNVSKNEKKKDIILCVICSPN